MKDPNAVKYDTITYDDVLAQHLHGDGLHRHIPVHGQPDPRAALRPEGPRRTFSGPSWARRSEPLSGNGRHMK